VLPDQEVSGGVVRLEIVEGQLETVEITGTRSLDARFLERRVRLGAGRPLDIVALQERLQLLLLDPSIERLDARLLPGSAPGQARLEVAVEEAPRQLSVDLGAANDQSPSIGGTRGELAVTWRNLLGRGDPLRLTLRGSEGLREVGFGYAFPLTARDLRVRIEGEASEADIIDDEVEDLDIESSSRSLTLGLSMPVYETVANRVGLDLALVRERNRTSLLDEPFAFSPGTDEGRTDLTLLRFTQDWLHRGRSRAVSAASTFTLGLDALGATAGSEPTASSWPGSPRPSWSSASSPTRTPWPCAARSSSPPTRSSPASSSRGRPRQRARLPRQRAGARQRLGPLGRVPPARAALAAAPARARPRRPPRGRHARARALRRRRRRLEPRRRRPRGRRRRHPPERRPRPARRLPPA
jgi:hemolysin activation/secretion protein